MEPWWWWKVLSGCFLLCVLWIAAEEAESSWPAARVGRVGPTWIALKLQAGSLPANDPSGHGVVSYMVRFTSGPQDPVTEFELKRYGGEDETLMTIEEMQPGHLYEFRITPRLADGSDGRDIVFVQRTADYERPDAVTITSSRVGQQPDRYTLTWNAPFSSGGHQIQGYEVRYSQADEVNSAEEPWQAGSVSSDVTSLSVPGKHTTSVTLHHLEADTYYAVTISAVTAEVVDLVDSDGDSPEESAFVFKTAGDTSGGGGERAVVLLILPMVMAVTSGCL